MQSSIFARVALDTPVLEQRMQIPEMDNRYLRVVLLADGETIHNAFFDRDFSL